MSSSASNASNASKPDASSEKKKAWADEEDDVEDVEVAPVGSVDEKKPAAEPVEKKKKPRCKFGVNCNRKETCAFFHPKAAHATKKPLPEWLTKLIERIYSLRLSTREVEELNELIEKRFPAKKK